MPFDWHDYLTIAQNLSTQTGEAELRTAISRAYYAVYNLALARARTNQISFAGPSQHKQLWDVYSRDRAAACHILGLIGARLKKQRVRADYENNFARIDDALKAVLKDANEFNTKLNSLPAQHPSP